MYVYVLSPSLSLYIYIYIYIHNMYPLSRAADLGKGQMGSALTGPLQTRFWQRDLLGTPVNLLWPSVKIHYFRIGPINVDPTLSATKCMQAWLCACMRSFIRSVMRVSVVHCSRIHSFLLEQANAYDNYNNDNAVIQEGTGSVRFVSVL